ncbi:MAG TPA: ATP synthase F0 subunit B [Thermoanaerobaculia bacterium]|nr:ATP synthase F0 subunit B [Thermoanaerobaculia bacterium]
MRRHAFLFVLILLVCGLAFATPQQQTESHPPAGAQNPPSPNESNAAGDVAHGAEKEAHKVAHPTEDHGEHHEEPKFLGLPAWIFKLINMVLFFGFLGYLVGKPIKGALASRREAIRREADEARERKQKADQIASDIDARLRQIEEEIRAIHQRAEVDGERQKRDLMLAAEAEGAKILQSARNEVDNRLKHARQELTEHARQLTADRAAAILKSEITEDDQRRLFENSLRDVREGQS